MPLTFDADLLLLLLTVDLAATCECASHVMEQDASPKARKVTHCP